LGLTDRYKSIADLPQSLPLFPLRGAILLPRSGLPLQVFEPRYLTMLDDAIASSRVIGIIQPATDASTESPRGKAVSLKTIGCAGRVTSFQELDDGRLMITLTGICRFETTVEELLAKPYRSYRVQYQPYESDLINGLGEDDVNRGELLRVLKAYLDQRQLSTDWTVIQKASTEFLVNTLSIISPFGPEEKQALLEAPDLQKRAEVLVALAEMELASQGGTGGTLQ
jgi:uncharacterized protein